LEPLVIPSDPFVVDLSLIPPNVLNILYPYFQFSKQKHRVLNNIFNKNNIKYVCIGDYMRKHLFLIDLDGTLLKDSSTSEIHKEDIKAIKRARKEGHVVCIATGRP